MLMASKGRGLVGVLANLWSHGRDSPLPQPARCSSEPPWRAESAGAAFWRAGLWSEERWCPVKWAGPGDRKAAKADGREDFHAQQTLKPTRTHVREGGPLDVRRDSVHGVISHAVGGVTWSVRGRGLPGGWTLVAVRTGGQRAETGTQREADGLSVS